MLLKTSECTYMGLMYLGHTHLGLMYICPQYDLVHRPPHRNVMSKQAFWSADLLNCSIYIELRRPHSFCMITCQTIEAWILPFGYRICVGVHRSPLPFHEKETGLESTCLLCGCMLNLQNNVMSIGEGRESWYAFYFLGRQRKSISQTDLPNSANENSKSWALKY